MEELKVNKWLYILSVLVIIYGVLYQDFFICLIGGIVGIACGQQCWKWAYQIKGNQYIAYLIGFWLGLIGLLIYYIYYRNKKKK